eukprot:TRINITY_DN9666_c0_g1_i1.p1 TRINITY_DN9666_c0_g1~~TRINITY_DN9666_c0_g1_i1.p1  ORF type:complete len:212 (+),score=38.76 TRINITY_DN9666_c0_g1_i1:76-711(+)
MYIIMSYLSISNKIIGKCFYSKLNMPRCYYYYLNSRGHLYNLAEKDRYTDSQHLPKGPTHLKDKKALNFFFRRIKYNNLNEEKELENHKQLIFPDKNFFPFVSKCMNEYNFLRFKPGTTPLVFHTLDETKQKLYYGYDLEKDFEPNELYISEEGRLYHKTDFGNYGLISSNLAIEIRDSLHHHENGDIFFIDKDKTLNKIKPIEEEKISYS